MEKGGTAKTLTIALLVVYILLALTAPFNPLTNSKAVMPYFLAIMTIASMVNLWAFTRWVMPAQDD